MRILFLHSDYIILSAREKAIEDADEISDKIQKVENVLVCFISIEAYDNEESIKEAANNILDILNNTKASNILLYPYVHLTNIPASPKISKEIFNELYEELKKRFKNVYKAPFGWYKEFEIKVKGHPLAELSRTVNLNDNTIKSFIENTLKTLKIDYKISEENNKINLEIIRKIEKKDKKLNKVFIIVFPDGKDYVVIGEENNRLKVVKWDYIREKFKDINKICERDLKNEDNYELLDKNIFNDDFVKMLNKEALGYSYEPKEDNIISKTLQKFGFEWELNSDYGHMRCKPYAALMIDLIADYNIKRCLNLEFPVYIVNGTNMFDLTQGPVAEHAKLYGDRLYEIDTDKSKFVLRYAGCFQQFLIAKDLVISYKNLPMGFLEIADSYRFEQSGEIELGFRLRRFYMPDLHIFCKNMEEAERVLFYMHKIIMKEMEMLGRNYELLINYGSPKMYDEYKNVILRLLNDIKKPALICIYPPVDERYWVVNIEYHIIDVYGRAKEIGTTQIDIGNSKRFEIKYIDEEGKKNFVTILHTAIIGSIERYVYALFDTALRKEKPELPLWIAPVQVRILPLSDKFVDYSIEIAKELEKHNIRVEVDDRNETLNKKIMDAERLWIPYIIVIGEKEINKKVLSVRKRDASVKNYKIEDLIKEILEKIGDYPRRPLYLINRLSVRPSNLY